MIEKKIKADELSAPAAGRIRELEVENERLRRELTKRPAAKRMITTADVTAAPTTSPRKNIVVSTTHPRPQPIGGKPAMLQTHGLPAPETPEQATARILARVKGDRISVVTKKEKKN